MTPTEQGAALMTDLNALAAHLTMLAALTPEGRAARGESLWLIEAAAALREAAASIARLHERLEDNYAFNDKGERVPMEPSESTDGIACRDATIRLLDGNIVNLKAQLAAVTAERDEAREREAKQAREAAERKATEARAAPSQGR